MVHGHWSRNSDYIYMIKMEDIKAIRIKEVTLGTQNGHITMLRNHVGKQKDRTQVDLGL